MLGSTIKKLHEQIAAICPIDGVSIGSYSDKTTWRIDFSLSATAQQKAAAMAVIAAFDVNAVDQAEANKAARSAVLRSEVLADAVIDKLRNATSAQITQYVQSNVTDIASAKTLLTKLALAIAYILREDQ